MVRSLAFSLLAIASFSLPVRAADWNGPIRQIISCSDSWFEIELVNKTMPYGGSNRLVRFMVKSNLVGAERFKQMYAMSLTAFAVQSQVWLGTTQATVTTSATGGNCNTNNAPAQDVGSMSTYR